MRKITFLFLLSLFSMFVSAQVPQEGFRRQGFIKIFEFSYCPGFGDVTVASQPVSNSDYANCLRVTLAYQFNPYFSLGGSIATDFHEKVVLLPWTIDARIAFLDKRISPVLNLNAGYAIPVYSGYGGLTANPSIGVRCYLSKNLAYLLSVGYKWQSEYAWYYGSNNGVYTSATERVFYKYYSITTGVSF
jgi:hypothetical protein